MGADDVGRLVPAVRPGRGGVVFWDGQLSDDARLVVALARTAAVHGARVLTGATVTGVDRQLVGQVAANLRRLRKPDPYQQKGVRYTGEVLKKKAGKTGAK